MRTTLNVAMLAPPWIPIPPPAYGGIEQVIDLLSTELVRRGHRVTLFAAPGIESPADIEHVLERPHPEEIQTALYEADHVARAFEQIDAAAASGDPYDVIDDHCGFTAFAFAHNVGPPLLHTLHGPFTEETRSFYAHHGHKARTVALSEYQARQAPRGLEPVAVSAAASWPVSASTSRRSRQPTSARTPPWLASPRPRDRPGQVSEPSGSFIASVSGART